MSTAAEYDQEVARLQKKQDWAGLERYGRAIEQQIRTLTRAGVATEGDHRLRIQALLDLQTAYLMLERPQEQLRAAQEAHRAWQQVPLTPDAVDDHYSFKSLANAHAANGQAEQARDMFLSAGASIMTRRQAEWFGNALLDLAAFEREQSDPQTALVLEKLVERLKRTSHKVDRVRRKRRSQNEATNS